ncbi:hypothetical protein [Streptomyces sp. TR02-1]|uniref:hypothetical protein n=1 Tax=Streptomyces sp. TR02-1 TaxID=3385977 RepID=UPI0039A1B3CE
MARMSGRAYRLPTCCKNCVPGDARKNHRRRARRREQRETRAMASVARRRRD